MKVVSCIFYFLLITFFSAANGYQTFEENGKTGLRDANGKIIIPPQYDALGWSDGNFSVYQNITGYKLNGRWGLLTLGNHRVTKTDYDDLIRSEGSLFIARKQSAVSLRIVAGCLNTAGKEVIPFEYDGIKVYSLRAIVFTKIGNQYRYGLIDLENKTIIPQQHQNIYPIGSLRFAVENFEGKLSIFTEAGKQITSFTIDKISPFTKNYAVIYQGEQQGVIDREGQIKVQPKYQSIAILEDGTVKIREPHTWELLDGKNTLLQKHQADSIEPIDLNLLKVTKGQLVSLADQRMKSISPAAFTTIGSFERNRAIVTLSHKYGAIDHAGKIIVEPLFDSVFISDQYLIANQPQSGKSNWMLLDSTGRRLTTKVYESITPLNESFFAVRYRGFAGAINLAGKEIIGCVYDSLLQLKEGLVAVKFHQQYGLINLKEEWIVTPRPNRLTILTATRYIEQSPQRKSLKATDGNTIYFTDNRITIYPDYLLEYLPSGTIWKINLEGRIADRKVHPDEPIEAIYEESEGLRAIRKNGKYGFIDSQGRLRIANRYEGVKKFSEELAPAMIRAHWGYINHQDQIAIQPVYDEVLGFQEGVALVRRGTLWGFIDKTGRILLPVRYQSIKRLNTKSFLLRIGDLEGLADASGKILIQPKYHSLLDVGNGFAIVERENKYGVINLQGISTIPLVYDYIQYDYYNQFFIAQKKALWTSIGEK